MAVIVSACLMGERCKWDGGTNHSPQVVSILHGLEIIAVCPEVAGGLTVPREPAEIRNGLVVRRDGLSVDEAFRRGAESCLARCCGKRITCAILKARSPSCGAGEIYDGSFSGKTTQGDGVFAALLKEKGIPVYTERQWKEAADALADCV